MTTIPAVPKNHHLVKSEPSIYCFADLVRDKKTAWDGVRNAAARNNLRAMKKDDLVLYYHTGDERQVVGIARVVKTAYPDPTADDGDWSAVDLAPVEALPRSVTLAQIKSDPKLRALPLIRMGRLSVMPVSAAEFRHIAQLGGKKK